MHHKINFSGWNSVILPQLVIDRFGDGVEKLND